MSSEQIKSIPFSLFEPHLKLPSGLSIKRSKELAKDIKRKQGVSLNEALKFVIWGNGITGASDLSQAYPEIFEKQFKIPFSQVGLLKADQIIGFVYYSLNNERLMRCEGFFANEVDAIEDMVVLLSQEASDKGREARFVAAIRDCLEFVGTDFVDFTPGVTLDSFSSKRDFQIDLEKLLSGGHGSSSMVVMRYLLGSLYNGEALDGLKLQAQIERFAESETYSPTLDEVIQSGRLQYFGSKARNPGALAWALDQNCRDIAIRLIENYGGW
ncbi:MAG: hypothetical protein GJ680_07785 [Alteromonadaceae bacterium]|nr:hypothetical protein [Alteromonadaceae bacterium]